MGFLATLQLLATMPDECLAETFYYKTLEASLYGNAIVAKDGNITVPTGPGLGLDPDLEVTRITRRRMNSRITTRWS